MTDVLAQLDALGIASETHDHPPVATVEEARAHWAAIDAAHTKNLLLKDDARRFWLVVMPAEMPLDLKALPAKIGSKRLRLASPDDLQRLLGVPTGAVSGFALANDRESAVTLVMEASLLYAERIAMHPLDNRRTTVLSPDDLRRWLASIGREAKVVTL